MAIWIHSGDIETHPHFESSGHLEQFLEVPDMVQHMDRHDSNLCAHRKDLERQLSVLKKRNKNGSCQLEKLV